MSILKAAPESEGHWKRDWSARGARLAGVLLRGMILGAALAAAVTTVWSWSSETRVFRHETF